MTADESLVKDTPNKRVWLKNLYIVTRILVIIAIIGMIVTSIVVILAGVAQLFRIFSFLIHDGVFSEEAGRFLSVTVTEMIDLYLIGLVLIIFALGLYQLFIDSTLDLPEWLDTPTFEVLKERLLIVIVVVLPVMFLGYAAIATDGMFIAGLGIAMALVMIAIGYILAIASRSRLEKRRLELEGAGREK
ncbi:putative membrane protein YqhA [Methanolinea mesophila]|uniref:YqhA family protein n=1 Tax=Methanolinea mesophila TaxID=547055 RepID=UPI001AE44545|nr:YqhA family protein [Methanolinea mesophila]MBP1927786.1 putative membrane protein YqhA [Methanolinea mesophila]